MASGDPNPGWPRSVSMLFQLPIAACKTQSISYQREDQQDVVSQEPKDLVPAWGHGKKHSSSSGPLCSYLGNKKVELDGSSAVSAPWQSRFPYLLPSKASNKSIKITGRVSHRQDTSLWVRSPGKARDSHGRINKLNLVFFALSYFFINLSSPCLHHPGTMLLALAPPAHPNL